MLHGRGTAPCNRAGAQSRRHSERRPKEHIGLGRASAGLEPRPSSGRTTSRPGAGPGSEVAGTRVPQAKVGGSLGPRCRRKVMVGQVGDVAATTGHPPEEVGATIRRPPDLEGCRSANQDTRGPAAGQRPPYCWAPGNCPAATGSRLLERDEAGSRRVVPEVPPMWVPEAPTASREGPLAAVCLRRIHGAHRHRSHWKAATDEVRELGNDGGRRLFYQMG